MLHDHQLVVGAKFMKQLISFAKVLIGFIFALPLVVELFRPFLDARLSMFFAAVNQLWAS